MSIEYDKLQQELEDTKHVNSLPERERIIAKISATALVDIAETLGQLLQVGAVESAIVTLEPGIEPPVDEPATDGRSLEVGDLVSPASSTEGDHDYFYIANIGESEGMPVAYLARDGELVAKRWLDELVRVEPFDDPDPADIEAYEHRVDAFANLVAARKGGNRA